ncbi:Aminopeptidase N [Cyphomyrmex costatus]|uniref:Aminopeptidase N n=1 Tax=Cyphomyrmex costatus TaxID=456900 RepID=A0A195C081_9HYME|nr:Aminopeptidase N [Cyphomyrmex costatus]
MNLYIKFSKLLLNIGLILATNIVFCIDDDLQVIHRLPNNTIPVHYNINLTLHLEEGNFIFYGESNVNIEIRFASSQISLHSRELEINETATTLVNDKNTVYKPMEYTYDTVTNILILYFDHELSPSFYTLNMRFTGNLSETDSLKTGFLKFPYTNKEGNSTWLAATHFEPDGARQVFPCWDEPALKATFNISIMHHQKYMVLSNMPRRKVSIELNDMIWTHFYTTPIMSTYLVVIVAIIQSDYVTIINKNENISMLCRSSLTSQVTFAHSIVERIMPFLIQYTNNSEKVPKVDNILIPNFPVEGMENWGLIMYRELHAVYNTSTDPTYKRREIAKLVTHELVHQWFGNLVTASWWSYLWLNEGFAVFFQTYIINKIFEDWRIMDFFVVRTLHYCLILDIGLLNSVTLKLGSTLENELLFSTEIYKKAPVLLRMLYNTVTDEVFRKGVITYLAKYQFNSTTPDDLWSAMQSALDESDVPHEGYRIKEVMDTWINQERYPVVNVMRNYETGEVTLSQRCFRAREMGECINSTWWIPVTYATESNPDFSNAVPKFWLRPNQNVSFKSDPNDWIILNVQQTGYYRVNYDTRNWHKISYYLHVKNYTSIHVLNRAQIISDSYTFMMEENKEMSGVLFINLISYLARDTDYIAWYPMFRIIGWLSKLLLLPGTGNVKIRMLDLLDRLLQNVGYEENLYDDDITKLKRLDVLKWACIIGHVGCKKSVANKLSEHLVNPDTHKIPQEREEFMYCSGLMTANRTIWDKMLKLYLEKSKTSNKTDLIKQRSHKMLLNSLSCVEDPDIIINFLNILASNASLFSDKEHSLAFRYILEKHARNNLILDYVLKNFDILKPGYTFSRLASSKLNFSGLQMCKMNLYIRFSKLLLNIGLILATNLVFCIDDNLKVIHRLPNNTIPVHYNIYLTLHLKEGNFTFYGESNVNIEIRFASSQISLHSKELEINETATTLVNDKGTVYKPMEYTYNNATNILILHFDHELSPSFYTLNMRFTGNLSESTDSRKTGIFKIPYTSEQGNTTWLAATHFEPDGARQVFPCWDEPALKATFNISIMNYDKYMALSNMPRRNISFEPNDMTWTYFDTTPIMSTYLVVIVAISRADFITISNANLNVSTLFRFSLQSQVRFAQDIAERAMTFLIQYTNNSEKVPKVDNILIPNFPIEGMENWGLITYKESSSTYDDRTDPTYKRKDVASLVAHEIAHQWFGNLVTPSWWSYIWLSEGLATFFETYIIDKIFKDWRTMDFFVVKTLHNCLMVDIGLMNSVTLKLDNVLEDELLFSIISKTSVLIRMLYNTITDKVFRNGLITYLSTHQFSSTTPDDLWSAMQSALDESDVPHEGYRIREVMNTWINQKRYPVINVMRNYETGEVTLSQTCFRTQDTAECINSTWWIPVTYATQSNPDFSNVIPKFWLRPDQNISFRINPNDWIILNLQQTGYYRINYDTRNWHKISYYLNSENYANVHVLNRAQIISDSYVLSMDENKEINGVLFVNLVSYLERETDYVAWYPMFKIVEYIWSSKYLFLTEAKSIKVSKTFFIKIKRTFATL